MVARFGQLSCALTLAALAGNGRCENLTCRGGSIRTVVINEMLDSSRSPAIEQMFVELVDRTWEMSLSRCHRTRLPTVDLRSDKGR